MTLNSIRAPAVALIALGVLAGCNRSKNADLEAARAEAETLKAELAKARAEADAANAELAKLRGVRSQPGPTGSRPRSAFGAPGKPDQPRSGVVRYADGKERAFDFIRGVKDDGAADPDHLIVWVGGGSESAAIRISELRAIEMGKSEGAIPAVFRTKDGKQQSLTLDHGKYIEVKWRGDIAVYRLVCGALNGSTITFAE